MDECADMTIHDAHHSKNVNFSPSPPHFAGGIDFSFHKNPFDRQFELARKNNINPLRYAPSIPNLSQTSPLNTPSISINDGAYISANVQDLIGPSPIIPTPNVNPISLAETPKSSEENAAKIANTNNNPHLIVSQRSNVVSVICPPVPTSKPNESASEGSPLKSPSVIIEPACESIVRSSLKRIEPTSESAIEISPLASKIKPLVPISLLPRHQDASSLALSNQPNASFSSASARIASVKESLSTLIKIVPKLDNPTTKSSTEKLLKISSLSSKKKEKSEEELLNKLKATEAALPPKAKPGRKSRSDPAVEDVREKKKRSLERNRAAAMRCRIKKKKEVDELKTKVEKYERQNKDLRRIIEELYDEVRELKSELLRHKDCC